jgi:S-adenosylmethionine/arginine decarboxylase-like enzyme
MKKTHMIVDLLGVPESRFEVFFKPENWYMMDSFLCQLMERERIQILTKQVHFFDGPVGAMTCLYLLSESHFSIHTFPEENGRIAMDLFTCGHNDVEHILLQIIVFLAPANYIIECIDREREDALQS